ncbi:hypothetical protein AMECASPLE_021801 [Ameca splendens]|uniref:Uncharacterized protein n=1 Tax=Ameca splendens TaxID=208324 RepID=A0ABV0ZZ79_9TELE
MKPLCLCNSQLSFTDDQLVSGNTFLPPSSAASVCFCLPALQHLHGFSSSSSNNIPLQDSPLESQSCLRAFHRTQNKPSPASVTTSCREHVKQTSDLPY